MMYQKVQGTKFSKYVAKPTNGGGHHNYGCAVDVTIIYNGKALDMGAGFDDFTTLSHINNEEANLKNGKLSKTAYDNRKLLRKVMRKAGFDTYFVDHTAGVYAQAAAGWPYNAASFAVKGDVIADLSEDMGAEQKARVTYDNILRMADDPDVIDVIRFLREREVVHFQRFGEAMEIATEMLDKRNVYAVNPSFDKIK